jgi:hypothetical protein
MKYSKLDKEDLAEYQHNLGWGYSEHSEGKENGREEI